MSQEVARMTRRIDELFGFSPNIPARVVLTFKHARRIRTPFRTCPEPKKFIDPLLVSKAEQ